MHVSTHWLVTPASHTHLEKYTLVTSIHKCHYTTAYTPAAGNPVSSFVCFHLVALPALRRLAGWPAPGLRRVTARLTSPLKMDPERPEYHRCTLQYSKCVEQVAGCIYLYSACTSRKGVVDACMPHQHHLNLQMLALASVHQPDTRLSDELLTIVVEHWTRQVRG